MTDLKQKSAQFIALAGAATEGPWFVHPFRAVVVPSPHASRPLGCHEDPAIDRETYAQEICALHWPDRNRNESEVRSNANLIASAHDMAAHIRALQAENDRLTQENEALRKDASMYRWCRDKAWFVDAAAFAHGLSPKWSDDPRPDEDDIEAAIEAAMAQERKS